MIDLFCARLDPHERPPAVALTGVLALHAPGTQHVVRDVVVAQRLPAPRHGDHRHLDLLQHGGQRGGALLQHAPPSHCHRVVQLHPLESKWIMKKEQLLYTQY